MWLPFLFLYEHILHGRQLGDYFPNQVASSKILGAMATKMVAAWRVVTISLDKVSILLVILTGHNNNNWTTTTVTTTQWQQTFSQHYIARGHASFFTLFFFACQACASYYSQTSIILTLIIWISQLSGLFLWPQFGHEYLLVTIKIRSHILFKTTALKSEVKYEVFLLSKSKSSVRVCCN